MIETFEGKIRAAARAGWWTLLIGTGFLIFQWIAYLILMSAQPSWPLALWGKGLTWDSIQNLWLWSAATFKIILWVMALVIIWLTLWARQLRKQTGRI